MAKAFCCMMLSLLAGLAPGLGQSAPEQTARWAILLSGVSGDPALQKEYLEQLKELGDTLVKQLDFRQDHVFVLFDDPSRDPSFVQYKSTREELEKVCRTVALQAGKDDLLLVFILGHGSMEGDDYKLNLVGPDPTGTELASMLDEIPSQRSVIVNTTNCSGGGLGPLSRKGRIVVTATRSGSEKNQTRMAGYFIRGLRDGSADTDKDGRVSVLEAFGFSARMVEDYYSKGGNLQTEHAQLDDNGDGQGHPKPDPDNGDGLVARTTYLDPGAGKAAQGNLTPERQALALEAESIQKQIEALKYEKNQIPPAEYEKRLEDLLVKLAQVNAKLRKKEISSPRSPIEGEKPRGEVAGRGYRPSNPSR